MDFASPDFWIAVGQIILIDLVLSGDNAVVIALACRNLPPQQRRKGILWGVAGAVGLRIALTTMAALVMNLPWLKFAGGIMLLWIGIKLLVPEESEGDGFAPAAHLRGAIRTIVVADFVMSLDNVIGVAGASHGNLFLLVFGLLVSIPLIVWSSQIILRLMERWPIIVTGGAALLGWVAGAMMRGDPGLAAWVGVLPAFVQAAIPVFCALFVVVLGKWRERRAAVRRDIVIE